MGLLRHHHLMHKLSRGHHGRAGEKGATGGHGVHRPKLSAHPKPHQKHAASKGPLHAPLATARTVLNAAISGIKGLFR